MDQLLVVNVQFVIDKAHPALAYHCNRFKFQVIDKAHPALAYHCNRFKFQVIDKTHPTLAYHYNRFKFQDVIVSAGKLYDQWVWISTACTHVQVTSSELSSQCSIT